MGFIVLIAGKASAGVGLIAVTFTMPSSQASSFPAAKAFLVTRSERWATSSKCIDLNGIWKTPYSDQANFYLILKTKSYSVDVRTFLARMFFPQSCHISLYRCLQTVYNFATCTAFTNICMHEKRSKNKKTGKSRDLCGGKYAC